MYYVQKEGVYFHGIFWIGDSPEEGVAQANQLAKNDQDSYHYWRVYKYIGSGEDKIMYSINKNQANPSIDRVGNLSKDGL